jgi:hypothetical protein
MDWLVGGLEKRKDVLRKRLKAVVVSDVQSYGIFDPYIDFAVVYLGHQLLPSFSYFAKLGIVITEHRYLE